MTTSMARKRIGGAAVALIVALLCSAALPTQVAEAQSDVQLWTDAGVRWRATRRLRLEFAFLARFDQDVSRGRLFGPQVGLDYKIKKWLRVGFGYRYEYRRIGGSLRSAHRLNADLKLSHELGRVGLGYRLRFQERFRNRASGNSDVRGTLRNRFGADVDTDTLFTPYASLELFTGLHGRQADPVNKVRITVGAAFDLGRVDLALYYRAQIPVNRPGDPTVHILGASVTANFRSARSRRRRNRAVEADDGPADR